MAAVDAIDRIVADPTISVTADAPAQTAHPPRVAISVAMNETAADNVRDTLIDREKDGVISSVTDRVRFAEILLISDTVNVSGADKVR